MKITKREKSTSTKGYYVRNADLLPVVIEDKAAGKVSDKLIRMIQMIAERYSRKHNFVNYSFREDMVSAAVLNLCNNALKFNPERSETPNPFSFYTTAIHNSFLQYIAEEKKHRQIRDKLLIDAGSNPSFNYTEKSISESDVMSFNARDEISDIEEPIDKKKLADGLLEKKVRKIPHREEHRQPSAGVSYAPTEMVYDEALGYYVKKQVEEPAKKPRKKKEA